MASTRIRPEGTRVLITNTDTGAQNNWAPTGLVGDTIIEWSGASDIAITGIASPLVGQYILFKNTGTKIATFANQSGSSSAGNKFKNLVTSGVTSVAPGGWILYGSDLTEWKLIEHEQGAWISPAFSAGDYTASGTMTWTVGSGDVQSYAYLIQGKTMHLLVYVDTTTVGGSLDSELRAAIPGGMTAVRAQPCIYQAIDNNSTPVASIATTQAGVGYVRFFKNLAGANWSAATDLTYVRAVLEFEVT